MDGSSRNAVHKMRSMRFDNSKDARSLRIEKHNDNRRMARQAKSNANRGLSEINLNTFPSESNESVAAPAAELTHEQKLQDRLNKLKLYREQKAAALKKEKARKKAPFVVPCHAPNLKPEKAAKETAAVNVTIPERTTRSKVPKETLAKPAERVTRSQARKNGIDIRKTPAPAKASNRAKKIVSSQKWEVQSFAPTNFVFTAPQEISKKGMEFINPTVTDTSPAESNNTPQRPKASEPAEEIKISPLLANNPWITMTRGSSSKKSSGRKSLDPTSASATDVQASPALKRRSQRPDPKESTEPKDPRDAAYFRALVSLEESRLTALCDMWEGFLAADVPEEETGSVRTVIGQAQLLQRERFVQFSGLIEQFENKTGEKEITPTDLEGFWEMIYLQVTDVDRKFGELSELRDNGWVHSEKSVEKKERPKRKAKEVAAAAVARPPRAARSNLRAHIAAARKNQLMAKSPKSPSVNRRRSSLLCSPQRTPGKRQSLRRSALILSAKKQMFIVTDMTNPEDEPRISQYTPAAEEVSPEAERLSVPVEPADVKCPTPRRCSSKKSLKADLLPADASPTCQNKEATREPMTCDDLFPDGPTSTTPLVQKTYGKTPGSAQRFDPNSKSPEERLSEAFDALKTEDMDKATPLKVFRTPKVGRKYQRKSIQFAESDTKEKDECGSPMTSDESGHCRRSSRLRTKEDKGGSPSLLPTVAVSPAEPKDDLMSFD